MPLRLISLLACAMFLLASLQCCYVPVSNVPDIFFGCTFSIKIVFSVLVLMHNDLSVDKSAWKPLRATISSVCCFCHRLFFKWHGYQRLLSSGGTATKFSIS